MKNEWFPPLDAVEFYQEAARRGVPENDHLALEKLHIQLLKEGYEHWGPWLDGTEHYVPPQGISTTIRNT